MAAMSLTESAVLSACSNAPAISPVNRTRRPVCACLTWQIRNQATPVADSYAPR